MDRSRRAWLAGGAGAALLGSLPTGARAQRAAPMPQVGAALPLVEVPLLEGGRFTPAQAEGKVLVLYWWASWCPFCAQQSPEMQRLFDTAGPRGLLVLGLSVDKTPEEALAHLRKKGYSFPSGWLSPEVARALPKPDGLPVTVVRGRDGKVAQAEKGQLFPEDVAALARWL